MKISEYSVKNYQFTLTMFLMAVALGITTLLTMPRSEDPELEAPFYTIVVVYPGTSPKDMEELLEDIKQLCVLNINMRVISRKNTRS